MSQRESLFGLNVPAKECVSVLFSMGILRRWDACGQIKGECLAWAGVTVTAWLPSLTVNRWLLDTARTIVSLPGQNENHVHVLFKAQQDTWPVPVMQYSSSFITAGRAGCYVLKKGGGPADSHFVSNF